MTMLFFSIQSFSQFVLEHSYLDTRDVQRVVLENSGEKYYSVNYQTGIVTFFNANHTFWKSVQITMPSQIYSIFIANISETKINTDENIEIIYSTYSAPNLRKSYIVNELGQVLLVEENCLRFQIDEKLGLSKKILSSNGNVYSVPSLTLEHSYPAIYPNTALGRTNLESFGEKYYYLDMPNGQVVMYHADHTFWKNILLPKPDGFAISRVDLLSEKQLNEDNLIEIGYHCYNEASTLTRIANENGDVLFNAINPGSLVLSSIEGFPNKLMIYTMLGDIPDETSAQTDVYSVPDFNYEHTYPDFVIRVKLENSDEKYYAQRYDYLTSDITIYNADHTLWKTIPTSALPGETIENVFVSQTKINPDAALEVGYTIASNTLDGGHYRGYVVKDNGTILLEIPGAYGLELSEFSGFSTKLITRQQDGPSFDQLYYTSTVYRIDNGFAVNNFSNPEVLVAPNPAHTFFNIQAKTPISKIEIYDSKGILIDKIQGVDIQKVSVEQLSSGLYMGKFYNLQGEAFTQKIMVKH